MPDDRQSETTPPNIRGVSAGSNAWLATLIAYLVVIAVGNLVWEFAQLPLYTIWRTGSTGEIVFAAVHCTGGDILNRPGFVGGSNS